MWQSLLCLVVSCGPQDYQNVLEMDNIKVAVIENKPFLSLKENSENLVGNDRFQGFIPDMVQHLSNLMGANFEMELIEDGRYGAYLGKNNWTGLVGAVSRGEADIAIADLTITPKRLEAVQFSLPFSHSGIVAIAQKAIKGHCVPMMAAAGHTFVTYAHGSTNAFIRGSTDKTLMKIAKTLVGVDSSEEILQKVKENSYVGLVESKMAQRMIAEDCDLEIVGKPLNQANYGIAMAQGVAKRVGDKVVDLRQTLDWAVTKLSERTLKSLEDKWWKERTC